MSPWAGRLKDALLVKYDPRNLARLYVRDPEGKHWPVPYSDLRQPPIALWELLEARKRLRQIAGADTTQHTLFASVLEQRRIVNEAASRSRQRRRKERTPSEGSVALPSQEPLKNSSKEPEELKPYPVEIWEDE